MLMKLEERKKHLSMRVRKVPGFEALLVEEVNTPIPSSIPVLRKESCLMWYPIIRKVALSPIEEEEEMDDEPGDDERSGLFLNIWRPLFHCELDAGRYREMTRRYNMSKVKRGPKKFWARHTPDRMAGLGEAIEA